MDALRLAYSLILVFGLLGLFWTFAKRRRHTVEALLGAGTILASRRLTRASQRGKAAANSTPSVVWKERLTPTHQLHLICNGKDRLLVCTHPQGCTLLPLAESETATGLPPQWTERELNDAA
jgi:hypothetical protein